MSQSENKRQFTKAELFEHCDSNPDRVFLSVHDNIYDVTPFLDEHPGGEDALKEHQIKNNKFIDASEAFEDVGHSADARDYMKTLLVGSLAGDEQKAPVPQAKPEPQEQPKIEKDSKPTQRNQESTGFGFEWRWLISFVVVIGVGIIYRRFKSE